MRNLTASAFFICLLIYLKISASTQESLLIRIARDGNSIQNGTNEDDGRRDDQNRHLHRPYPHHDFYPMPMYPPPPPPPFGPPGFPFHGHGHGHFYPPPPPPPQPPINCNHSNGPEGESGDENRNNSTFVELPVGDKPENNGTEWISELFPLTEGKAADPDLARSA